MEKKFLGSDMDEKRAFMALSRVKGLNRLAKRLICDAYSDITGIFGPPHNDTEFMPPGISARFSDWKGINADLKALDKLGARVITLRDADYPPLLKHIPDAPVVLYARGPLKAGQDTIAIVGSRKASTEGIIISGKIGETVSSTGITVVSGLARGIDTAAHCNALHGTGKTVAVLGCGIDICYPPENKGLFENIAREGLLVTEYAPGQRPMPHHFPERNRIIAGISRGVLVVEATAKSGSLITARLALEYGREVMAMPGSVLKTEHAGSNRLIKDGARLVDSVEDVLITCFPHIQPEIKKPVELDSSENKVYSLIGFEKIHADEVIERSGMDTKDVRATLTRLAMRNIITEAPGGFFVRA
ncbi:MAG: family protein involved in uptake [Deltaproteobacteria bacterium]|nr:family protein involved in uptake [Deltaproteobacteria bacterium]